ncbi:hypothetical protein ABG79_02170 [Caloramator mitchellensis]|uniref:Uncharacterized protein n=1 Tax=Caloramator mitchellensis TaxID=908809 RepID=A0A0R3JRE6_CALMK|nr:hypothetical protein [Caloramator mitchellensis]KRQ86038.1 hypothetical protein ABG79_02170 [Caloramator mitchellensis]
MLKIIVSWMIGGMFGFLLSALLTAAKDDKEDYAYDWVRYKCLININAGCSDYCCMYCQERENCKQRTCKNEEPKFCGQSIISMK